MLFRALLNLLSDIPLQNLKMLGFFGSWIPTMLQRHATWEIGFRALPRLKSRRCECL